MMFSGRVRSGVAPMVGLVALCAAAGSAQAQVGEYYTLQQGAPGQLATPAPYPEGRADDVRRPGFNGRLWIGRPIIGGADTGYPSGWRDPGPSEYGADENDASVAYVRIGNTAAAVSPWEYVRGTGLKNLEEGRRKWLDERGYTGGVRTFVNDLYLFAPDASATETASSDQAESPVQPRATIHMSPDQPRFKARMRVNNDRAKGAAAIALLGDQTPMTISWPGAATTAETSLVRVIVPGSAVATGAGQTEHTQDSSPAPASATPVASADR